MESKSFKEPDMNGHVFDGKCDEDGCSICSACSCRERTEGAAFPCPVTQLGRKLQEVSDSFREAAKTAPEPTVDAQPSELFEIPVGNRLPPDKFADVLNVLILENIRKEVQRAMRGDVIGK